MPLYEFDCAACGKPFEKLVHSPAAIAEVICPTCGSHEVKKKISLFASLGNASRSTASSGATCSTGST